MELKFLIDENYLIYHMLRSMENDSFSNQKYKKDIVKFQDFAWEISQNSYNFLVGRITPNQLSDENIKKVVSDLPSFLKSLKASSEFKKVLEQTQSYLELCQKQWEQNFSKTSKYISEITGLNLNKNFTIYITHPSLKNGHYIGDNQIAWGHKEEWPNYITVYLWHEVLHSYFGHSDIDHAVIELITDEELRSVLNREKYPPFVGHSYLEKTKKNILPKWKEYLNSRDKNIKNFTKELSSLK